MRETTAILFGAVSEILAETLDHQAHSGDAADNPYFTPEDFEHVRELASRVDELRNKARCHDFSAAAAALLTDEASRCSACAAEIAGLLAPWRAADDAVQASIADLVAALGAELYVLCRSQRNALLSDTAIAKLLQPYGIDRALRTTDHLSIEGFRPDEERITTNLNAVAKRLHQFTHVTQDLTVQAKALADSVKQRLAERQILVLPGATDNEPLTDIGRLEGRRKQFAFLKLSHPPSKDHFECDDALTLFLNVAEDIGSGTIVPRNAQSLTRAYDSFMAKFAEVNEMLSQATGFQQQGHARVAGFERTVSRLHEELNPLRIQEAVDSLRASLGTARKLLTRATHLAHSGDITAAQDLSKRALTGNEDALTSDDVDRAIADQAARMHAIDQAFADLRKEGEKQASGWRGIIGGALPFLNSHDDLCARLTTFYDRQVSVVWGPGSELSRKLIRMIRESHKISEIAGYKPPLRPWIVLSDAVDRAQPRDMPSSLAFVNALCAMAAVHDSLSDPERAAIHKAVGTHAIQIEPPLVDGIITEWRNIKAGRPLLEAISQAIVDTDAIFKAEPRESLLRELQGIARADGEVGGLEVIVYRGFFARITRLLHDLGGDSLR